jgi:hypothetical protein
VPEALNDEQRALLEKLASSDETNVRARLGV